MLGHFGIDFFGFLLAQAAKFTKRQSFLKEKRNAREHARGKSYQPEHHRGRYRGFLFHSI